MTEWKAKRFWKAAAVTEGADGFGVALDGRAVKTPAKRALIVPRRALAEAIAEEWDAQEEHIDPLSMPYTRSANAAIDKVADQKEEVASIVAAYGDSDLLSYRAGHPEGLIQRQAEVWDPYLDWADAVLGVRLQPRVGVMHAAQDPGALARLDAEVRALDPFALTAFHDLVALSGSLILAFAVARGHADPKVAWAASRLDEDWQIEQWGADEEATEAAAVKYQAFIHAAEFFAATR